MKALVEINGKSVEIDLTPQQVVEANRKAVDYTDIKTLQDALDYVGESLDNFNNRTQFDDDAQRAYKELEVIVLAIRQGNELGERWYYPWFNSTRSSSGFSFGDYFCAYANSSVGFRLCVESSEKAIYLGKQFIDIYNRYINGASLQIVQSGPVEEAKVKEFKSYKDIGTFEEACFAIGIDPKQFHSKNKGLAEDTYAYEQLKVISKALNGGEHMDYSDEDEYKYYPYFTSLGSSSGFSYGGYFCGNADSGVGSRLTYKSREIAEYAGKTFLDIYNKYIN